MSSAVLCAPSSLGGASPVTPAGTAPLLPVVGADTRVPLVRGGDARYVDLDAAASSRSLACVAARVTETLPTYASVHRGAGWLSQVSTALYESARDTVAGFVGARGDDVCVLVRHTTDALNLLAGCVPDGGAVLVLDCEHHADLLPWQQRRPVTVLPTGATVVETLRALGAELAAAPYALVAVTAPPTSPGSRCRSRTSSGWRTPPAPGCWSTAPSWCRTAGSPWPTRVRTTSPSPGTRRTPPSARARWSAGGTGSTRRRRTWPVAARCRR
jgi:hypothetical protein